jgi:hypothetical protein
MLLLMPDLPCPAQALPEEQPVFGDYYAHDPSPMIKQGNTYYIYRTSQGIMGKTSTDLRNWTYSGQVFPGALPAWITNAVPGFTNTDSIWAPDVVYMNGQYYLYYAVSLWGTITSAIGLATSPSLASPVWTDQGPVIQFQSGISYNCIDPSILLDTNGAVWMSFGSYSDGIFVTQLNPATGKRITANSPLTKVADNSPFFFQNTTEASFLYQQGGYYYLFLNFGGCCSGVDSTYNIRVGRSTNVTGPFLDRNKVNLTNSGGAMFLESTGRFIGPGQAGILNDNGTNWLTYHYYDGNNGGTATLGLGVLTWSADGWPVFTNDWSAFYPFNAGAGESFGLYNGALKNGAVITNDPARGNVLSLDGVSQYVLLPNPVANASTFATWVKWNGGGDWQRIFDFGASTNAYFFLTPRAGVSGKLRFAITLNGSGAEQHIDAPAALPTNSWCHVAVTLDGTRGLLYLNGNPVATNSSLTIRPWQTLAVSNFIGKSQFPADPAFNGRIGSFRIFGRALTPPEITDLVYAHPALAHRYSFSSNVWDSIGLAHGALMGNATVANRALTLTGASGGYANLPGGLVSGCAAATMEFWAAFGVNGNWARVFDFGATSGANGQQFLFFSPHTGVNSQRVTLSTSSATASLDVPGTLDGATVHVVCIVDPANNYCAIYTNGMLESAATAALPPLSGVSSALSYLGRSLFSADAWLNGAIDEFRIYDGRLSPQEIMADHQGGPNGLAIPVSLAASPSAQSFILTWPSFAVGFVLESAPALGPGAQWSAVTNAASVSNSANWVALPVAPAPAFFRLRRPDTGG